MQTYLGTTRPDNCSAVLTLDGLLEHSTLTVGDYAERMGFDITDPAYLPDWRRHDDPRSARKYKCSYCGVWSDNDIGLCEHCGAPKE